MKRIAVLIYPFMIPNEIQCISESKAKLTRLQHHDRQYDPSDKEETCYIPLSQADVDGDGKLSKDEYAQFANDGLYGDLPFELQVTFIYLDCLSSMDENGNVCDGKYIVKVRDDTYFIHDTFLTSSLLS